MSDHRARGKETLPKKKRLEILFENKTKQDPKPPHLF